MLSFEKQEKAIIDSSCFSYRVMLLSFFLVLFLQSGLVLSAQLQFPVQFSSADRLDRASSVANGSCKGAYVNGSPALVRCNDSGYILAPWYFCPVGFFPVPANLYGDGTPDWGEGLVPGGNPEACGKYFCPPGSGLAYAPQNSQASHYYGNEGYVCSITEKFLLQESLQPPSCTAKHIDTEGNPCSPATGSKIQSFKDYESLITGGLIFMRTYSSQATNINPFAAGWKHNYSHLMDPASNVIIDSSSVANATGLQQSRTYYAADAACQNGWNDIRNAAFRGQLALPSVAVQYAGGNVCNLLQNGNIVATLSVHLLLPLLPVSVQSTVLSTPPQFHSIVRGNGSQYLFQRQGTQWKDPNHPGASLVTLGDNWLFTDSDRIQERYDGQGRLTQITNRQGQVTRLYHDLTSTEGGDDNGKTLDKVTDPFGRSLAFSYQADGKLTSVSTPDGPIYFNYDALDNLIQVTYPDNTTETYHYEKAAFPHHLTGITDGKGIRFAIWDYDDQGRAILSEHAGHTDKVTFVYNSDGTTTVADALGAMRTYHFQWAQGGLKVKKITGDRCSTCGNGDLKERTYDANGYLSGYTDWNGIQTTYARDATGLELSRTEAAGTPDARTITTAWHADFRRPLKIIEEGRITEFSYDAQGRLLSQTVRGDQK